MTRLGPAIVWLGFAAFCVAWAHQAGADEASLRGLVARVVELL